MQKPTEKTIKQSALPVQILLQALRYVVENKDDADDDFIIPEDEQMKRWIDSLIIARDAVLDLDKAKYQKLLRSVDRVSFDITTEFFVNREIITLIYANYKIINRLIAAGKWKIPLETETHFYKTWDEISDYLFKSQAERIEKGEKSANKLAGNVIIWLQDKRGFYQ